jgi:ABC-type transport system involved in multi-copper enzyme maturation permease subunit
MTAISTVGRIAGNTFKESVRDKVPYSLVLFAILLIGVSLLLSELTAGQEVKIIKDLGLAAISLFGLFIAVFIGTGLVSKEVEKRSIYSLLTKPMTRPQFIVGKYAGLVLTLTVNVTVMTAALYAVLAVYSWTASANARAAWEAPAVDPALLKAALLILVELAVVTALALLFSTFSGPVLSAAFTAGLAIAGHFNADLKNFETAIDSQPLIWLTHVLYYVLPNLASFDVKTQVVHALPVTVGYIVWSIAYAGVYITALLLLAMLIFARRDFK